MQCLLIAILFLLCMGQVFAAASAEEQKKACQQKTGSSKTPPSTSRLSKPVDVSNKPPSGTLSSEERKKLEAGKYSHARSKTVPVFHFPFPQAPMYQPEVPVPVTYIKAPTPTEDDSVMLYRLVDGYVALHKPFGEDEAERIQDQFLKATGIKATSKNIYETAANVARMRAETAKKNGHNELLQIFTNRAAECDASAKKAAARG
jgi:hypothetical protein